MDDGFAGYRVLLAALAAGIYLLLQGDEILVET
jgi:hypothetical protein